MYQALLMVLLLPLGLQESDEAQQYRQGLCSVRRHSGHDRHGRACHGVLWTSWIRASTIGSSGWLLSASRLPWRNCPEMFYIRWGTAGMRRTGAVTGAVRSLQSAAGAGDHANIVKYGENRLRCESDH